MISAVTFRIGSLMSIILREIHTLRLFKNHFQERVNVRESWVHMSSYRKWKISQYPNIHHSIISDSVPGEAVEDTLEEADVGLSVVFGVGLFEGVTDGPPEGVSVGVLVGIDEGLPTKAI